MVWLLWGSSTRKACMKGSTTSKHRGTVLAHKVSQLVTYKSSFLWYLCLGCVLWTLFQWAFDMFATLHARNYNCDFPFTSGPRIIYVHVQALYNWWFARNLLAILVSRQSGFYICPGFVFIVTNRVVLSYSTNMLVFRANTNLLCTNVAWLSNLWLYPRLVGVSRYLKWHYWCYYWISLAVGEMSW